VKLRKVTPEIDARLDRIARSKSETPTYKQLERETGLRENYLRQIISAKMKALTNKRSNTTE
jgi:hypothetical protein